jgi:multicomponent Na+:H+ antiporter subunit D
VSLLAVPLAILWPAAIAASLLDGRRRWVGWASVGVLAATFAALVVLMVRVGGGGAEEVVAGGWPIDVGIRLRADALGAIFALLSCGVLLAALANCVIQGTQTRLLPALTLFMALGLTGLFITGDIFSFYVFFELAMIAAYALTAVGGEKRQLSAAFIFAVVNLIGSFVFLIAVGALYRATGTLEMIEIATRAAPLEPTTAILIAVSFFVAFGVKLGLFPFHFWLPTVYVSVSPAVAAMLSGALANIGAYGLLRFGGALLPRELELTATALIVIGTVSIVYGAIQAISRRDTREVLAYSAIGHAGYVLVALGLGGAVGLAAAVVFTVVNALNKALLFLSIEVRGPIVAGAFLLGAFSVAGVPPSAGFFGKAALFDAGVATGSTVTVILLFIGGALSFVYLFQAYQHDHWQDRPDLPDDRAPLVHRTVTIVLALVVLGIGLWPEPLLSIGEQVGHDLAASGGLR